MIDKESERAAREYIAGVTVATLEFQFAQLAEHVAFMTPDQAHRILAAVERFSAARKMVIAPNLMHLGSDARN